YYSETSKTRIEQLSARTNHRGPLPDPTRRRCLHRRGGRRQRRGATAQRQGAQSVAGARRGPAAAGGSPEQRGDQPAGSRPPNGRRVDRILEWTAAGANGVGRAGARVLAQTAGAAAQRIEGG